MVRFLCIGLLVGSAACASTHKANAVQAPHSTPLAPASPVAQRSIQIPGLFASEPGGLEDLFAPSFFAAVPQAQVAAVFSDYFNRLGPCTGVVAQEGGDGSSAKFLLEFGNRFHVPMNLVVAHEAPHSIVGLLLGNPIPTSDDLQAILEELHGLPGKTSFLLTRLGEEPTVVAGIQTDTPLAIGSAFKLYVLAELVRSVKARERTWSDVVALDAEARSLPSGFLHTWPTGAPITLHTLASLMISQSDNTATDQLVHLLGREKIEAILPVAGHGKPQLNRPFLTTLELFKIKGEPKGEVAQAFLSADESGRRELLSTSVRAIAKEGLVPLVAPRAIETLEWFASASDLSRLMAWLEEETRDGDGHPARGLLAINPGVRSATGAFRYVGFKGGSEPGVLNLTFLLEGKDGALYTLAASWNDAAARLDEKRFVALIERALLVIGR